MRTTSLINLRNMKMRNNLYYVRRTAKKLVWLCLLFALIVIWVSPQANADSDAVSARAPVPGSSTISGSSARPYYAVGEGSFNGEVTWLQIYVPLGQATYITVQQACNLDLAGTAPDVTYSIRSLKAHEDAILAGTSTSYIGTRADHQNCQANQTLIFNTGAAPKITTGVGVESCILGHGDDNNGSSGAYAGCANTGTKSQLRYRTFVFEATINNSNPNNNDIERSFRLCASDQNGNCDPDNSSGVVIGASKLPPDLQTQTDQTRKYFGIYQRNASSEWDYAVQFAPSCSDNINPSAAIKFYDADANVSNYTPQNLVADVLYKPRSKPNASWSPVPSTPNLNDNNPPGPGATKGTFSNPFTNNGGTGPGDNYIGGNNQYSAMYFQADPANIYELTVKGINWRNTLQLQLPYDQIDGLPTTAANSVDCNSSTLGSYTNVSAGGTVYSFGVKNPTLDNGNTYINSSSWVASNATVNATNTAVTFKHDVFNDGPDKADYTWQIKGCYVDSSAATPVDCSGSTGLGNYSLAKDGGNDPANNCENQSTTNLIGGSESNIGEGFDGSFPKNCTYQFSFKNTAQSGDKYCQLVEYNHAKGSADNKLTDSKPVCVVLKLTNVPVCNYDRFIPQGNMEVGQSSQFRLSVDTGVLKTSPAPAQQPNGTLHLYDPSGALVASNANFTYSAPIADPAGPNWLEEHVTIPFTFTTVGKYNMTWTYASLNCSQPIFVVLKPYVKVYNGDVDTSGGANCSAADGIIDTLNYGNSGAAKFVGSSAELTVAALADINGFTSNGINFNGTPPNQKYLTLANTASDDYGGNSGITNCPTDYMAAEAAAHDFDINSSSGTNNMSINPTATGSGTQVYDFNYNTTTDPTWRLNGLSLGNGTQRYVYVHGDVYITGNITFSGASGGWASTSDIPSFWLIASGNIYIAPNVTDLAGVYVSEIDSNGNGGTIYTCATDGPDSTTPGTLGFVDPTHHYTDCNSQLRVHGSFIANVIQLFRSFGTLLNSSRGETDASRANCTRSNSPATLTPNGNSCAGEVFDFSPEVYLGAPPTSGGSSAFSSNYDSITSLPPVL